MNYSQNFAQIPTKDLWRKIKIFCRQTVLKRGIYIFFSDLEDRNLVL